MAPAICIRASGLGDGQRDVAEHPRAMDVGGDERKRLRSTAATGES
jgi:hypothetical protein